MSTSRAMRLAELRREAEAMYKMSHPNILRLWGASLKSPRVCLVLQLAPHGSLFNCLRIERAPNGVAVWRERLGIAPDVVKGLDYLHRANVLHRDIKSGNVLLFGGKSQRTAQLSDFGLAKIKTGAKSTALSQTSKGTINWQAPEIFDGENPKWESDIYSCACVMYELGGTIPWTVSATLYYWAFASW